MLQTTQVQMSLIPHANDLCDADGTPDARAIRKIAFPKMSAEQMAEMLDVPVATYRSWEAKKKAGGSGRKPSGAALSLLKIAAAAPDLVRTVLAGGGTPDVDLVLSKQTGEGNERTSLMTA